MLIDEIPYATELLPYIKMGVDRSYVDTYLQRDIRDLAQVADEMQFYNFMTIVAAQTSKPVVYEELASAAGISAPTAKKMALYFGVISYRFPCAAVSQQCTETRS